MHLCSTVPLPLCLSPSLSISLSLPLCQAFELAHPRVAEKRGSRIILHEDRCTGKSFIVLGARQDCRKPCESCAVRLYRSLRLESAVRCRAPVSGTTMHHARLPFVDLSQWSTSTRTVKCSRGSSLRGKVKCTRSCHSSQPSSYHVHAAARCDACGCRRRLRVRRGG